MIEHVTDEAHICIGILIKGYTMQFGAGEVGHEPVMSTCINPY